MSEVPLTADPVAADPISEYAAGLRGELAGLPAPEVAEILDDVRAHLVEVVAEIRDSGANADLPALTGRLGTPAAYAAELRAAAGYPSGAPVVAAVPVGGGQVSARLAVIGLVGSTVLLPAVVAGAPALVVLAVLVGLLALPALIHGGPRMSAVAALPEVRGVRAAVAAPDGSDGRITGFVASLQPAWWVLRALVAAGLVAAVFTGGGGSGFVGTVLVALVAVPVSVWLGHRSRRDRRWLWVVVPLNALAGVLALVGLAAVSGGAGDPSASAVPPSAYPSGLWQDSERQVRDIRPVDAAGRPLSGVYLFDQDGRPLDTGEDCLDETYGFAPPADPARPYPRGLTEYDPITGRCVTALPVPLVVAVPATAAPVPTAGGTPAGIPPTDVPPTEILPTPAPTTGPPPPSR